MFTRQDHAAESVIAEQNRMLLVEADVRNNGKLRPGSFAHAEIVTNDAKMASPFRTTPSSRLRYREGDYDTERESCRETDYYRPP
jgi:hypothetical protein